MKIIKLGYYAEAFADEHLNSLFLDVDSSINKIIAEKDETVCHYFPKPVLTSIIRDQKLYFSDSEFLNDFLEGKHFYSKIENVIADIKNSSPATDIFREILRIMPMTLDEISFDNKEDVKKDDGFIYNRRNYVFCCSLDNDCLSNWKYYGKGNGYEGYNISFKAGRYSAYIQQLLKFRGCKCFAGKVIYDDETKEKIIYELIKRLDDFIVDSNLDEKLMHALTTRLFYYIMNISLYFKDISYQDEKEYRFIICLDNSKIRENSLEYDFRFANDILIPFLKIPFDKNMIEMVGVGPCMNVDLSSKSLYALLQYYKYNNTAIGVSTIPLRY